MERLRARPIGTLALGAGTLAILLAIFADEIGVGDQPGFNWKQGILLAAGIALALFGAAVVSGLGGRVVEEAIDPAPGDQPEDPPGRS